MVLSESIRRGSVHGPPGSKADRHFRFRQFEFDFAYSLIRKNASSAFVRFFGQAAGARATGLSRLRIPRRYWEVEASDAAKSPNVIVVLRDPMDRLMSLYVNKFIELPSQGKHPGDIAVDAERILGVTFDNIDFKQIILDYATNPEATDEHLRPQSEHLVSFNYNCVVTIDSVHPLMRSILGDRLAERFFQRKVNSSSWRDVDLGGSPAVVSAVESKYASDFALLESIEWSE